ncbi:AAA family ATPase [Salegentibacter sp. LM13S]|uniref:HelD family protein n=1 Tax=Salegentibacter lacus TaxID=2873599 RepID=UPI001CCA9FC5|nr:UvrD-helicase domain-containing protein [Salegentibacter lacus]MBZ9630390.1 AAA family ATPase [Salegentibacter lacus]
MEQENLEKKRLKQTLTKIDIAITKITKRLNKQGRDIKDANEHMQEHKRDMDHLEKNAVRESVSNMAMLGRASLDKKKRLLRLKNVTYFGRLDFKEDKKAAKDEIYVGVHNFKDEETNKNLVYDWRAPISSMFYDYEPGPSSYITQEKVVDGLMSLKRQFRIRNGEMEYMLDNDIAIQDEVLQKELKQASSSKMKNIVATIQREQNAIIRNEEAQNLIIQGVAGSGKTSIALHRIAFLLYKFKDDISSEDILIISPNKVFASYISNVLPELGEETVEEISLEEIADRLFDYQIKFQSFFEQVSELLERTNEKLIERIEFKSSQEILKRMDEYLVHLENNAFQPQDIFINKNPVPAWFIEEKFKQFHRLPILKRFNEVVREIVNNTFMYYKYEVKGKERTELHSTIRKMFPSTNLRMLYKGFYEWMERKDLLKMRKGATYEYSDVYPLLYLKMKLEGLPAFSQVKHLVIDEMQDYSPVQYKVLSKLFSCKKTILGDINQSVNPFSSSDLKTIQSIFPDSTAMTMLKSYRSTYEITQFSKRISDRIEVEALKRHGSEPGVHSFNTKEKELSYIKELIERFKNKDHNSLGIICKTQKEVNKLYEELKEEFQVSLLDGKSVAFGSGVVITTAHLAKGLEFDMVIVPNCTEKNYKTEPDRQMLYVACTRAMHRLEITSVNKPSQFLKIKQ